MLWAQFRRQLTITCLFCIQKHLTVTFYKHIHVCACVCATVSKFISMLSGFTCIKVCIHISVVMWNSGDLSWFNVSWRHSPQWADNKLHVHSFTVCLCICVFCVCVSWCRLWHLSSLFCAVYKSDSGALGGYSPSAPPLTGTGFWQALCRAACNLKTPPGQSVVVTVTSSKRMCPVAVVKKNPLVSKIWGIVCDVARWPWFQSWSQQPSPHTHRHGYKDIQSIYDTRNLFLVRVELTDILHTCMHAWIMHTITQDTEVFLQLAAGHVFSLDTPFTLTHTFSMHTHSFSPSPLPASCCSVWQFHSATVLSCIKKKLDHGLRVNGRCDSNWDISQDMAAWITVPLCCLHRLQNVNL